MTFDKKLEKMALDNTLPDDVQKAADKVLSYRERNGQVDWGTLSALKNITKTNL